MYGTNGEHNNSKMCRSQYITKTTTIHFEIRLPIEQNLTEKRGCPFWAITTIKQTAWEQGYDIEQNYEVFLSEMNMKGIKNFVTII